MYDDLQYTLIIENKYMLKQIKILDNQTFMKIPVYPQIFTPFMPPSFNRSQNNFHPAQLQKDRPIQFKYLSMAMESTGKHKDNMGIQYIYGYDCINGILDVASVMKNQRYRFILPLTCKNKQTGSTNRKCIHECNINKYDEWCMSGMHFEIRNKLLILVYRAHVYIHDLVRHNYHTNPSVLANISKDQRKSLLGIMTLRQNSHFIFKIEYEQKSVYVYLQLYSIDMANNFSVQYRCDHIIRIVEQSAQIQALNAIAYAQSDREGEKLILCTQVQQAYPKQCRMILHTVSMKWGNSNISVKINMLEADNLIVNHSSLINERKYSKIRSSWVPISKMDDKQQYQAAVTPLQYIHAQVSGKNMVVGYKKNKAEIIVFHLGQLLHKYVSTNIIEHKCSILDMQYGNNKLYILDINLNLWAYQFPQSLQQQEYSIINTILMMQPCLICSFQSQLQLHPQCASFAIKSHNAAVILGTSCYIFYPNFMPILDTLSQEQALLLANTGLTQSQLLQDTSMFLSVQQSKFVGNISTAHGLVTKMIRPYIPMLSESQTFNIGHYLIEAVMPKIGEGIYVAKQICLTVKYEIVSQILSIICAKLRQLKVLTLGSIYDCQQNHFYWFICQLFNKRQQKDTCERDILRVLEMMAKQKQEIKSIISKILIKQKLLIWLKQKCDSNLYKIICTTNFRKCTRSDGCPCTFKRLIKCMCNIDIDEDKIQNELNEKIRSILIEGDRQIKQKKQENWTSQIQALVTNRYQQEKERMMKMQKKKVQKIDEQFSYLFTSTRANTIDNGLEKQNRMEEQDGENILQQNTISNKNIQAFLQLSFNQRSVNHTTISYLIDEKQYEEMVQQYLSIYHQFTTKVMSIYNQFVVNNSQLIVVLEEMTQLVKRESLLSKQTNIRRPANKQNKQQKQNKRKKLVMVSIVAYKIYQKYNKIYVQQSNSSLSYDESLHSELSDSFSISGGLPVQQQTLLIRQLWVLIIQIISFSVQSKYQKNSQIAQMCTLFLQSTTNYRLVPALALLLEKLSNSKCLVQEQLYCLVESFIYTELYRFNKVESNKEIKKNIEDIYQHQFKYDRDNWQKGIKKIINVYEKLKFST